MVVLIVFLTLTATLTTPLRTTCITSTAPSSNYTYFCLINYNNYKKFLTTAAIAVEITTDETSSKEQTVSQPQLLLKVRFCPK